MPSIISATTTNGVTVQGDNSGSLQLATNSGTTAVTIDTSQNVTFAKPITVGGNTLGAGNATSFKNRIINGAMVIDQRNAGAAVTISSNGSSYLTDRFRADAPVDQSMTFQQQTSVIPNGFSYALKATAGTATTTATNQPLLAQFIEGFNMADLGFGTANAKTITLSFWVRSSLTGTFGVCFENNNADRGYIASYTINVADTFEYKTITIAGDTSGTWETTNQRGLSVFFDLGFGTTYSSAASTAWANVERGLTGGVKLAANTGATWFITGVQLEVGSTATSFDYRPYGTELSLCQRYYYRITLTGGNFTGIGRAFSSTQCLIPTIYPCTMRTSPSALEQTGTAGDYGVGYGAGSASGCSSVPTFSNATIEGAYTIFTIASGLTAGGAVNAYRGANSPYLGWSAEL
jgi:hypothetical protein